MFWVKLGKIRFTPFELAHLGVSDPP